MEAIAVPLRLRRQERARFVQKLQHAVPSIVLLFDGIRRVRGDWTGESLAIAGAEIAVSVLSPPSEPQRHAQALVGDAQLTPAGIRRASSSAAACMKARRMTGASMASRRNSEVNQT